MSNRAAPMPSANVNPVRNEERYWEAIRPDRRGVSLRMTAPSAGRASATRTGRVVSGRVPAAASAAVVGDRAMSGAPPTHGHVLCAGPRARAACGAPPSKARRRVPRSRPTISPMPPCLRCRRYRRGGAPDRLAIVAEYEPQSAPHVRAAPPPEAAPQPCAAAKRRGGGPNLRQCEVSRSRRPPVISLGVEEAMAMGILFFIGNPDSTARSQDSTRSAASTI